MRLPAGSAIQAIQQTRVSTGGMSTLTRRRRHAAMAAGTSSTAKATHAGPCQFHFGSLDFDEPLRQSVSGSVANSDQKSFHSWPRLKPKSFW